jgi:hypothetical protein
LLLFTLTDSASYAKADLLVQLKDKIDKPTPFTLNPSGYKVVIARIGADLNGKTRDFQQKRLGRTRRYGSAPACVEDLLRSHKTPRQDRDPTTVADAIAQPRRNGLGEHVGESKKTEGVAAPHDDWIPWLRE